MLPPQPLGEQIRECFQIYTLTVVKFDIPNHLTPQVDHTGFVGMLLVLFIDTDNIPQPLICIFNGIDTIRIIFTRDRRFVKCLGQRPGDDCQLRLRVADWIFESAGQHTCT